MAHKKNKNVLLKLVCILLVIASSINLVVSFRRIIITLSKEKEIRDSLIIKFNNDISTSYKVHVKDNDFIPDDYLEGKSNYLRTYTEYISVSFDYNYLADRLSKVDFNYKIIAEIDAFYNKNSSGTSNPEIWTKEVVLSEGVHSIDTEMINFSKSVDIYLDEYENEVNLFAQNIKLPVTSKLNVYMIVDVVGKVEDDTFNASYKKGINFPINQSVYQIEELDGSDKENIIYRDVDIDVDRFRLILNILLFFTSIIIIVLVIRKFLTLTNKTEFEIAIDKYLKNYDDKIVSTTSMIDISKYNEIKILDFYELLTLSTETNTPIMYFNDNKKAIFYVFKENQIYTFIIKNKDN